MTAETTPQTHTALRQGALGVAGIVYAYKAAGARAEEGGSLAVGERFGLIRFGSRVDVFLPDGVTPRVAVGQTAVAGETVLAEFGGTQVSPLVRVS